MLPPDKLAELLVQAANDFVLSLCRGRLVQSLVGETQVEVGFGKIWVGSQSAAIAAYGKVQSVATTVRDSQIVVSGSVHEPELNGFLKVS